MIVNVRIQNGGRRPIQDMGKDLDCLKNHLVSAEQSCSGTASNHDTLFDEITEVNQRKWEAIFHFPEQLVHWKSRKAMLIQRYGNGPHTVYSHTLNQLGMNRRYC